MLVVQDGLWSSLQNRDNHHFGRLVDDDDDGNS